MEEQIKQLYVKESNLRARYNQQADALMIKPESKRTQKVLDEMAICTAYLYGAEEQLHNLLTNRTESLQIEFINNLLELDFDNDEIERIADNMQSDQYLCEKYEEINTKSKSVQTAFKNSSGKFAKILVQFIEKRKAYWKKSNKKLLEELVLLKSNIIKHLCIMEELAGCKRIKYYT
jgi:hypothetical protein